MDNSIKGTMLGLLIGCIAGVAGVYVVNMTIPNNTLFNSFPDRNSFELQDMCNKIFSESKHIEEKRTLLLALVSEQVLNAVDDLLLEESEISIVNVTVATTDIKEDIDFIANVKAGKNEILIGGFLRNQKIKLTEVKKETK